MERTQKIKTWIESPYLNRIREKDLLLGEERNLRLEAERELEQTLKKLKSLERELEREKEENKKLKQRLNKLAKAYKSLKLKHETEVQKLKKSSLFFLVLSLTLLTLLVLRTI